MTNGQLDTTTVYGTIAALSQPSPSQVSEWAWESASQLFSAIVGCEGLTLAPVPKVNVAETSRLGEFIEQLAFAVRKLPNAEGTGDRAVRYTHQWAGRNLQSIAQRFSSLQKDRNYQQWLDWNVEYVWPEHCARLRGLSDKQFEKPVCAVLGLHRSDLEDINARSCDDQSRNALLSGASAQAAKDAYVVSILLRGAYYGYLSRFNGRHFVFHQVRQGFLPKISLQSQWISFDSTLAEKKLFHLLLASVYRERTQAKRLLAFAALAGKGRDLVLRDRLHLPETQPKAAEDAAIRAATQLFDLTVSPTWADWALSVGAGLVIAAMTSFILQPWQGFLVGGAATFLAQTQIGESIKRPILVCPRPLRALMQAPPGRIIRTGMGGIKTV